jgi:RNA polymerase sigma factor (sigma-70 family)
MAALPLQATKNHAHVKNLLRNHLVARHGPMVLGLCRRVLGNTPDVEDAFQATFLVLARKAASLRDPAALAAWLYGVAYRVACKARAGIYRRQRREITTLERSPADPHAQPLADLCAQEEQEILDEELARLPEAVRLPLVLCCLEGLTQEQAAARLGCTPDAVRGRLQRGRTRLAARLSRRCITMPAVLLAARVADGMATVPATLLSSTARAAVSFAAGVANVGRVAPNALALAEQGMRAMMLAKMKLGVLLLLAGSVAIAGVGTFTSPQSEQHSKPSALPIPQVEGREVEHGVTVLRDLFGDPLPPHALARMGTVRFRHGALVSAVAFSQDGNVVASGSYDNTVRLWEPLTGKEILWYPREKMEQVWSIALSPDGQLLCVGGVSHFLHLYSLRTGKVICQCSFANKLGGFKAVAFSPDGKTIAGGSITRKIGLWDVTTGMLRHELQGHEDRVTSVSFSPDGKTLVSASLDRTVRLWDTLTGKELHRFIGHQGQVNAVAF